MSDAKAELGPLVGRFMAQMHRHDAGRTLPLLHASKLTTPQVAVLEFTRTPRTLSAIAEHVGLSQPATSQMVEKLVQRGLVLRELSSVDRRERAVRLSAKGAAFLERLQKARSARFEAALAALPADISQRLGKALAEAADALERLPDEETTARPTGTGGK